MASPLTPTLRREIFDYLKLELSDEEAELLMPSSIRYVGASESADGPTHYLSFPTSCGIGWVALDRETLSVCHDVPAAVAARAQPREAHRTRGPRAFPSADRSARARAAWVPYAQVPRLRAYPVWFESIPFERALGAFGARAVREHGMRHFHVHLSSSRYAMLVEMSGRGRSLEISLELDGEETAESMGQVHLADVEEVLTRRGLPFEPPKQRFPYEWV